MPLHDYTTTELLEEVARRALTNEVKVTSFCEDCGHFVPNPDAGKKYNPCDFNHRMEFKSPDDFEDLNTNNYGFYRVLCTDRTPART